MLPAMDAPSAPAFDRLVPAAQDYASRPVASAFNWTECVAPDATGEWYLVAFRSVLRASASEARLLEFDDRAFEEASGAPGFVHYLRGPIDERRQCLSFCLWDSRAQARAAAGRPAHLEATGIAHAMYERYALEFYRVRKRHGSPSFEFEPYDRRHREAA